MFDIFGWLNLDEAYNSIYSAIAALLSSSMIPSIVVFRTDWFRTTFGSTIGLGQALLTLVTILVGLRMILQPLKGIQGRPIGKILTSIWTMALLVVAFYPIVTFSLSLATWLRDIIVSIMTGVEPTQVAGALDKTVTTFNLTENVMKLVVMVLLVLLGLIVYGVAMAIQGVTILVMLIYPVMVMLRPLGGMFDRLFHAANAVLAVALLGPSAMTAGMLLPRLLQRWLLGENSIAQAITAITASMLAIWLPFAIGSLVYERSSSLIGSVETRAYGAVSMDRLPPMDDQGHGGSGAFKAFGLHLATGATTVAASSGSKADFFQDIKHVMADAAGTGLTMAGHPIAGSLVSAADTVMRNREERKREAAQEETQVTSQIPPAPLPPDSPNPGMPTPAPQPNPGPEIQNGGTQGPPPPTTPPNTS